MNNLDDRLHSAPFVRLLVPFVAGILLAEWLLPPKSLLYLIVPVILAALLFFFKQGYYRQDWNRGFLLITFILFTGFLLSVNQRYEPQELFSTNYNAILDEFPVEKDKSYRAVIRLLEPSIKVLAYFEKSDEIETMQPGILLYFNRPPELIKNLGNPFEFDYRKYSVRNNIGHRIYLQKGSYHFFPSIKIMTFRHRALILREKLLQRLAGNGVKGETFKVISAITLGARDNLDPETTQSFMKTGTIHVLAVSGGNVAIVFMFLHFFFRSLKKGKTLVIHTLIILCGIWAYTIITGLSPSVLRAATMFSFITVGNTMGRNPNINNSLASSAFILLCFKPALLFDAGFQLSYAAVFAIVLLHPFFFKLCRFKYWIPDKIWMLFTISIAAQLGTLPISLWYFHQFPNYFWLTNLIIVPLVSVLLYLTLLVILVVPFIHFLGRWAAQLLNWIGEEMLKFLHFAENLPYAVMENIYPSAGEIIFTTLFIILLTLFVMKRKAGYAVMALSTLVIVLIIHAIVSFQTISRKEVVIFNIHGKVLMAFTKGRETVLITDEKADPLNSLKYFIKPYEGFRRINRSKIIVTGDLASQSNSFITIKSNFINYCGLKFCMMPNSLKKSGNTPRADVMLVTEINNELKTKISSSVLIKIVSPLALFTYKAISPPEMVSSGAEKALKIGIDQKASKEVSFNLAYFDH